MNQKKSKTTKIAPINLQNILPVAIKGQRQIYAENPFLGFTVTAHKRSMTVSRGTEIVSEDGGESFETTIAQVKLVDEGQFIKLFTGQVSALFNLCSAGIKTFGLLLVEAQSGIGSDRVFFSFSEAKTNAKKNGFDISKSTYTRGINDLLKSEIIAASEKGQGWFFINPAIIFNGDRARFVTEYRKIKNENPPQNDVAKTAFLENRKISKKDFQVGGF